MYSTRKVTDTYVITYVNIYMYIYISVVHVVHGMYIQVGLPGHCRTVWYVPQDPTVPYGTNGMEWTGRITWSL